MTDSTEPTSVSFSGHFPLIIGHRGASAVAPENTLAAFARAARDGADGIEFDVRLARDEVPVVIHDATLRRTGLRAGKVGALSAAQMGATDVGAWFNLRYPAMARAAYEQETVPTLEQVFELFGRRFAALYVEMKCIRRETDTLAAQVAELVRACSLTQRVVVKSFTLEAIKKIKRIAPEIRTAALFDRKLSRPIPSIHGMISQAIAHGADELSLHYSLINTRRAEAARRRGLKVVAWTVDEPLWIKRAIPLRLHAIITNQPALARATLEEFYARA